MANKPPSKLQQELKQTKPFDSHAQEATLGLFRTADRLRRKAARAIEPFGISLEQYNVLRILRGAGQDGLPTLEVAARMIEEFPAITRLMDKLEAKALVRRERCPKDRRQVLCWISASGLELLHTLDEPVRHANRDNLKMLNESELNTLIALLDRIRDDNTKNEKQ